MKNAFITGASGHLGSCLVRYLLKDNWIVKCLINKDTKSIDDLNVEKIYESIFDEQALAKNMIDCDVVFHLAAIVAQEKVDYKNMIKVNVGGTKSICNAALKSKINKLIYFSSIHAFNQSPYQSVLNEKRQLVDTQSASPYDFTKALAQKEVYKAIEKGLDASILHPTGVIGPYDYKPSRMGQMILDIKNKRMPLAIKTGYNWVDVRDVCSAAIKCVKHGKKGQNYIVSGDWRSFKDLSILIQEKVNKKIYYGEIPFLFLYIILPFSKLWSLLSKKRELINLGSIYTLKNQCSKISYDLAKNKLNHNPRSIDSTITDTLSWFDSEYDI
ncbi:MAG: NAD-dependent epimerase/dehydratase family protein [bacterium TMED144]|nr:MAG: NAD-dependent epimerase/dehydratase family protein [bacterium TMED144]|tara:strand:+ start:1726 stop:2709 length:984 start_codon:yes stop_codon:yes gene_type:complete